MSRPRHLVWDWNGTLFDDLPLVVAATNAAFAAAGGPQVTPEAHRRDFRRPIRDYYAQVLGRPIDDTEFARLDRVFRRLPGGIGHLSAGCGRVVRARCLGGIAVLAVDVVHTDLVPTVGRLGLTPISSGSTACEPGSVAAPSSRTWRRTWTHWS